ncbi:MAG: hypothetical protein P8Y70_04150 [Candidatus Lokiarchaeota archaeon]
MIKSITVSEKLRTIISKHYKIVVFKEVAYCFLPICIIEVNNNPLITDSESPFKHLQQELKQIGFQVRLQPLSEKELRSYDIDESLNQEEYKNPIGISCGYEYYGISFRDILC